MIVIAIIGVLAAILIPNFLHARAESQSAACEGNERQIAVALEEYAVDTGGIYPANGTVNPALFGASPIYILSTPLDPVSGNPYQFTTNAPDCSASAKYEIIDAGGHDPTVQIPNAAIGATTIFYCSDSGLTGK